ncbi:MAG TPA: hypothetical protein VM198_12680 [Longimicrobiales bacterium]|nr:hypothetical protein [Longimicrobiales bacterium]
MARTWDGTQEGAFMGFPASGRRIGWRAFRRLPLDGDGRQVHDLSVGLSAAF